MFLSNRVHALPEIVVAICHQLTFTSEPLEWLLFPVSAVSVDVVEYCGFEHEESSVDPALFRLGFLRELDNLITLHFQMTETSCRPHCRERCQLTVPPVELKQIPEIEIRNSITPGEHEGAFVEVRSQPTNSPSGLSLDTGVDKFYTPVFHGSAAHLDPAGARIYSQVAIEMAVVDHVFLDDFAFVTKRDYEVPHVEVGIMHHDVPQDRLSANLNHRLGTNVGLFSQHGLIGGGHGRSWFARAHQTQQPREVVAWYQATTSRGC